MCKPFGYGTDIIIHSTSKYMDGYVAHSAFLLNLSLETLVVRLEQFCNNALDVIQYLKSSEKIESVSYPGLEGDESYALAKRCLKGCGGYMNLRSSYCKRNTPAVYRRAIMRCRHIRRNDEVIRGLRANRIRKAIDWSGRIFHSAYGFFYEINR